jgi:hypothetical protein
VFRIFLLDGVDRGLTLLRDVLDARVLSGVHGQGLFAVDVGEAGLLLFYRRLVRRLSFYAGFTIRGGLNVCVCFLDSGDLAVHSL